MTPQTRRLTLILLGCCGIWSVASPARAEDIKDPIFKLINEADNAPQLPEALAKLQDAETLLRKSQGQMGPLAPLYLTAEVSRFRGRAYLAEWNRAPEKATIRDQARQELEEAQKKYDQLGAQANKTTDELIDKLPISADPAKNPQVREAEGYERAARYGTAYTQFALGTAAPDPGTAAPHYRKACEFFSEFTGDGYKNNAEVILLFLNQARSHLELGENEAALALLKEAKPVNTPPGLFKQVVLLRMQACRQLSKHAEAEDQYGKPYFDSLGVNPKYEAADIEIALARARSLKPLADKSGKTAAEYQARLNRIVELIYSISGPAGEKYKKKLSEALGAETVDSPFFCLTRARRSLAAEDWPAAVKELNRGLSAVDGRTDPSLVTDLKHLKSETLLTLARLELVAGKFDSALARIEEALPAADPVQGKSLHNLRAAIFQRRAAGYFSARQWDQTLATLEEGLRLEQKSADKTALADLDYLKLATYYTQPDYPRAYLAARHFLNQYPADRRAENVCTLGVLAGRLSLKATSQPAPKDWNDYLTFLQTSRVRFPDFPIMKQAPWLRAELLIEAGQYREAEQSLRAITPESPVYFFAQYGLALSAYRQWEAQLRGQTEPDKLPASRQHVVAAMQHLLDGLHRQPASAPASPATQAASFPASQPTEDMTLLPQAVELVRAIVRRLLDEEPPQTEPALALLKALDTLPDTWPYYLAHRLALRIEAELDQGNSMAALTLVGPLLAYRQKNDRTTLRALLLTAPGFAKQLERFPTTVPAESAALANLMIRAYEEILEEIHASRDPQLAAQEPGVRCRLGLVFHALGLNHKAIEHLSWIEQNAPAARSVSVVRGLARAYQQVGQYQNAVQSWNVLANNLPKASTDWYEAQYEQIRCCLAAHQPDQARKMMNMYRVTSGKVTDPAWAQRFTELEEILRADARPTTRPFGSP